MVFHFFLVSFFLSFPSSPPIPLFLFPSITFTGETVSSYFFWVISPPITLAFTYTKALRLFILFIWLHFSSPFFSHFHIYFLCDDIPPYRFFFFTFHRFPDILFFSCLNFSFLLPNLCVPSRLFQLFLHFLYSQSSPPVPFHFLEFLYIFPPFFLILYTNLAFLSLYKRHSLFFTPFPFPSSVPSFLYPFSSATLIPVFPFPLTFLPFFAFPLLPLLLLFFHFLSFSSLSHLYLPSPTPSISFLPFPLHLHSFLFPPQALFPFLSLLNFPPFPFFHSYLFLLFLSHFFPSSLLSIFPFPLPYLPLLPFLPSPLLSAPSCFPSL